MAMYTTSLLWESGEMEGDTDRFPSLREDMEWKMISGLSNNEDKIVLSSHWEGLSNVLLLRR